MGSLAAFFVYKYDVIQHHIEVLQLACLIKMYLILKPHSNASVRL